MATNKKKKKKNDNNNFLILIIVSILFLIVATIWIINITYSYFAADIEDVNANKNIAEIQTANLLVKYQDGTSSVKINEKIEPSSKITKEFSVKNEGNDAGMYIIALENIKHNLGHKEVHNEEEMLFSDISYSLVKIDNINNSTTETVIATGSLPFKSGEKDESFVIYTKDEVLVNKTNNYRLELTYINYQHIDQSDSMGEKLELKVNIAEYDGEIRTQNSEY